MDSCDPRGSRWNRALPGGGSSPFKGACTICPVPPLKGEVPAKRTEGFADAEFGNLNLRFPDSSPEPAEAGAYRQTSVGGWGSAKRSGASPSQHDSATPTNVFRGIPENRRIRELESMVPEFVARTGGSRWVSALPTGSRWNRALPCPRRQSRHEFSGNPGKPQTLAASIYGGQRSSPEPAAATGCRLSLPGRNICVGKRFFIDSAEKCR